MTPTCRAAVAAICLLLPAAAAAQTSRSHVWAASGAEPVLVVAVAPGAAAPAALTRGAGAADARWVEIHGRTVRLDADVLAEAIAEGRLVPLGYRTSPWGGAQAQTAALN